MVETRLRRFKAVALGISTGGVGALKRVLGALPPEFPLPILVVQHISPNSQDGLPVLLDALCPIHVKEADEGEVPGPGTVYVAPPNYHLLVERDGRLALSTDPPVCFARPSADVLFESAALVYGAGLIGIVLTGAGSDGSHGLKRIKDCGGLTIIQEPGDAEATSMPNHALQATRPDHVVPLALLPQLLARLGEE